jgi:hypothetical protein
LECSPWKLKGKQILKAARSDVANGRRLWCPEPGCSFVILLNEKQPMDVPLKSSLAQGARPKTKTSERLVQRQALQRIWTTISLVNLSVGFSVFGILIIIHRHRADLYGPSGDSFVAAIGGVGGLAIGISFLVAAFLHWSLRLC